MVPTDTTQFTDTGGSRPADEAWALLERSTQDSINPAADAAQDLQLIRENGDIHITPAIARLMIDSPETEAIVEVVLPHLCRCSWCRGTLYETLHLCGTDSAHLAWAMLAETEDWARWEAAGLHATREARRFLLEHGANVVYARDGIIWEERPDGAVERIKDVEPIENISR